MKISILAETKLVDEYGGSNDFKIIGGSLAGICYANKGYSEIVADTDKCISRFERTMENGHHSVNDHAHITLLFEGTSKIFAMLLNSVRAYNTSEKSGRYTVIGDSPEYTEWYNRIYEYCTQNGYSEAEAVCTARETARYQLSVFNTGTTFAYTTSYRMLGYMAHYALNLISKFDGTVFKGTVFEDELKEFANYVTVILGVNTPNYKPAGFDFLLDFDKSKKDDMLLGWGEDHFGSTYCSRYAASFVALAQMERHRTLKFNAFINLNATPAYYVPKVIKQMGMIDDWKKSLMGVSLPQATELLVYERGTLEDFILKCEERICMRAQEEVRKITMTQLVHYTEEAYDVVRSYLEQSGFVKIDRTDWSFEYIPKCGVLKCQEPCGKAAKCMNEINQVMERVDSNE